MRTNYLFQSSISACRIVISLFLVSQFLFSRCNMCVACGNLRTCLGKFHISNLISMFISVSLSTLQWFKIFYNDNCDIFCDFFHLIVLYTLFVSKSHR